MSIKAEVELGELRKTVDAQAQEIVALQAAVSECQRLLREMTRASTPRGKAA